MGRVAIPTQLKIIRGNPGKRPLHLAPVGSGRPARPAWLTGEARAEWVRLTDELEGMGLLASADRGLMTAWCAAWAQFRAATEWLAVNSPVAEGANGGAYMHPYANLQSAASERLTKLAAQFGLSPAARARIQTPDKRKDADEFDAFQKRKSVG